MHISKQAAGHQVFSRLLLCAFLRLTGMFP